LLRRISLDTRFRGYDGTQAGLFVLIPKRVFSKETPVKIRILILTVGIFILASSHLGRAQQPVSRIGFIFSSGAPGVPSPLFDAFRQGLRALGNVEGKNILIERRYAEGRLDRMPPFVHEFVQQKVDVIVGVNNVVIRAAKEATKTIPIVMISSVDPVVAGYVESFARPGGNITGLTTVSRDLSGKRVELLKEVLPKMSRLVILWDMDGPGPAVAFEAYQAASRAFKLQLRSLEVRGPNPDFAGAFQAAKTGRADALIVVGNPLMTQHAEDIFELTTKHRLPSMTEGSQYVEAGSLMSYGANRADLLRHAATYVDKILKGAKPGDLPVMLPTKFEIFINLKTAHQIGLVIPQRVLIMADKVIK
jgi:putative ABC transport system substrate-binding protein